MSQASANCTPGFTANITSSSTTARNCPGVAAISTAIQICFSNSARGGVGSGEWGVGSGEWGGGSGEWGGGSGGGGGGRVGGGVVRGGGGGGGGGGGIMDKNLSFLPPSPFPHPPSPFPLSPFPIPHSLRARPALFPVVPSAPAFVPE